jgi:hypothetical protein
MVRPDAMQLSLLEEFGRKSGGEGGIRTLGTGVSPYNGLAKGSFLAALTRFKGLQS